MACVTFQDGELLFETLSGTENIDQTQRNLYRALCRPPVHFTAI